MLNQIRLFLIGVFVISICSLASSQEKLYKEIELSFDSGTVKQYLDSVEYQLGVVFVYSDVIAPNRFVKIQRGRYTLNQLLDSLFFNQSVLYIVRNRFIILSPQTQHKIEGQRILVRGKVLDKKDLPVPFATVYIENKSLGTITNSEGSFKFILPLNAISDTITISSVGFESRKVSPQEYLTKYVVVKLNAASIPLKSIIVRPLNPEHLVMKSYMSRKDNYSRIPVKMEAFFRESSKQDGDYIALTEALVEINKSRYTNDSEDVIRLLKGRNGTNINKSELVNLVVEGGLYNSLKLDIVKYSSYFYGEDALAECNFKSVKTVQLNDRLTYVIGFTPKKGVAYASYSGKLYIDAEKLALVRAEFHLSDEGVKYARNILVKKSPKGFTAKPIYANYEVEYRYYEDVWNLYYARSDLGIKVKRNGEKQNKGFSCVFSSYSEFVVTGISDSTVKKIPYREMVKSNDVLAEQVQNPDLSFWIDNNIILPEEPLIRTLKKLQFDGNLLKKESTVLKVE
jgi:hypothetical protein